MRNELRIDRFLSLVDNENLLRNIWKLGLDDKSVKSTIEIINENKDLINQFWHGSPDLRYSQVLVNLGILNNFPGFWYGLEDDEILELQGVDPAKFMLWGSVYNKDMTLRDKVEYKFISDLDTDHIKAIVDGGWCRSLRYLEVFKNELKRRENDQ